MELCKKKATDLSKLWIHMALILLAGIVFCGWGLSRTNFFQFDDYSWQWSTLNTSFADLLNVIPNAPYNDRPVGAILIKGLFSLFGMNEVAHHTILLLIHLVSSLLLYAVMSLILRDYLRNPSRKWMGDLPWISAVLFAGWSTSTLRAVYWDSAVFDLLAGFFVLVSSCFYFLAQEGKRRILKSVVCLLAYGLALRSKEMSVLLPCMLACITVWQITWSRKEHGRPFSWNPALLGGLLVLMVAYVSRILWIKSRNHDLADPLSPYFLSHDPLILLRNLIRYLAIYFNPFQDDYISSNGPMSLPFFGFWSVLCIGFLGLAVRGYLRDRSPLILIPVLFVLQIAPVLPIQNMQTRLYLYIPSIILSILTATGLCWVVGRMSSSSFNWRPVAIAGIAFLMLLFISMNGVNPTYRGFYLSVGRENKKIYNSLSKMPRPPHGATVCLVNVPEWLAPYCLFAAGSGSGDILRTYYDDSSLETLVCISENHRRITNGKNKIIINYRKLELW
jgi:hypothetical protein